MSDGGRIAGQRWGRRALPYGIGLGGLTLLALALSPKAVVVETHHHEAPAPPVVINVNPAPMVVNTIDPEFARMEEEAYRLRIQRAVAELQQQGVMGRAVIRESQLMPTDRF